MQWLDRLLFLMVTTPIKWLVKVKSIPSDLEHELGIDKTKPIVYLLRTNSVTDQLALKMSALSLGLPKPTISIEIDNLSFPSCLFLNNPNSVLNRKIKNTDIKENAAKLFSLHRQNPDLDIQIVPVSILWGRAPGKNLSGWSDVIANQVSPSWLRKFFIVLFLGRDNFVCYSKAVSSRVMIGLNGSDKEIAHKLIRVAGTHFHRRQQSITGPNLLERHQLYNSVLGAKSVTSIITQEAKLKNKTQRQIKAQAKKYLDEIAADYREGLVRWGANILTKVWNKIYNGIKVSHASKVRELAQNGHEIIYVPCHRSHMDYLLLTYVIYHEGLVTPHIAAGINLNFRPVGGLLRKCGAFYLRRSFAGNKLYTAVFREYLELLFNKGYSVKYFPEGGRSRTGRLLPPKTGMLAMTLQGLIKGVNRPVSIVPVYIGYDHVMEVSSYLKELNGTGKKKESFFQVFSALKKLKNYGVGYLNFGEPINLSNYLDQHEPNWRDFKDQDQDKKPQWLTPLVNELATDVMAKINQAAAISGMSICATCLLAAKKHAIPQAELEQAIDHYLELLKNSPYSDLATIPQMSGKALLAETLKRNKFTITEDDYGKIISLRNQNAVALTYYRNNTQHLYALPSLIAAIVFAHKSVTKIQILQLVADLYPLLKCELFIYMSQSQAESYTEVLVDNMVNMGLLIEEKGLEGPVVEEQTQIQPPSPSDPAFYSAWLLGQGIQETLHRYALVLTLLSKQTLISRSELEKKSRQFAQRLSSLHGLSSPEFFDKNVLSSFISALKENQLIEVNDKGQLAPTLQSTSLCEDVIELIEPEIIQRLQKI
ncbi:glycerol-3-phosphate 1-O-acyltransferase PlsB [Paraglaciecola aquimarina]|uniref:Glycerol-3-phosphate acyltransferase n=1 Tax=Paraglaciecola algarum TaxID=3050085 RepID=A0ABS9DBE6_9ALTE|nr:glycerol-3-phosphate 1-O-acyltransferase PlsB [Paraglaciecola sp. G1-23]MCF2950277.1 glycerol-3-phosphate 1-O-acyltransferase PlsB [Paraglaciecola sp. G1-23]